MVSAPAWAAAGMVGPTVVTMVQERTGSYTGTLMVFAGLFVCALIVSILLLLNIRKLKGENEPQTKPYQRQHNSLIR